MNLKDIYVELARTCDAYHRCNSKWKHNHELRIRELERELPSGSGIDSGCEVNIQESNGYKLVIDFGYHHMDEYGGYWGWTQNKAIITSILAYGILVDIKLDILPEWEDEHSFADYISQIFQP